MSGAATERKGQYVFPSAKVSAEPRSGIRRDHAHTSAVAMFGSRGLWLAFGSFPPSKVGAVVVGQLVREEFERAGFAVERDGTYQSRILLSGFEWQRRSPDAELCRSATSCPC